MRTPAGAETDAPNFLAQYPELKGKRVILFLGRMHLMKGLDALARGFAAIAGRFPDAALLVAGPDIDGSRGRMASILREAGVLERAVFPGMLTGNDKLAALRRAGLFVLSSYSEGFSVAVIEALACGLPVVISEECCLPEVAESEAGFVVGAAGDQVAGAMSALLSDDGLRARMGRNGRKLVEQRYTWESVAQSVANAYRAVVDRGVGLGGGG